MRTVTASSRVVDVPQRGPPTVFVSRAIAVTVGTAIGIFRSPLGQLDARARELHRAAPPCLRDAIQRVGFPGWRAPVRPLATPSALTRMGCGCARGRTAMGDRTMCRPRSTPNLCSCWRRWTKRSCQPCPARTLANIFLRIGAVALPRPPVPPRLTPAAPAVRGARHTLQGTSCRCGAALARTARLGVRAGPRQGGRQDPGQL